MKVTTLADGSQLQYIKVSGPVEDRWISHADSMLATNRPEHAQSFFPAEALTAYLRLVSLGCKGLSLTNALPETDRKVLKYTLPSIGSPIKVRADGVEIGGTVTGHSEKDGKPIIDYLGPCKLSSGQMSKPTTRWAWVDQLID